jgi:hypothetical protein
MSDPRQELAQAVEAVARAGDLGQMSKLLMQYGTDDFVEEWPQSRERLTREVALRMADYPQMSGTSPVFTYGRMLTGGDLMVLQGTIDYGDGVPVSYVGIGELQGDKVARVTEYFASPFDVPEWRKGITERMEPATS